VSQRAKLLSKLRKSAASTADAQFELILQSYLQDAAKLEIALKTIRAILHRQETEE
jgi:hypothetical protein